MTYRELRAMLYNIHNQDITVKELRAALFAVSNQDSEIPDGEGILDLAIDHVANKRWGDIEMPEKF